jgi:hypothetical protein
MNQHKLLNNNNILIKVKHKLLFRMYKFQLNKRYNKHYKVQYYHRINY